MNREEQLHPKASPTRWEAPSMHWPDALFKKHRHLDCSYYKGCLDYASGLHWEGWSCNWCELNPHRSGVKKSKAKQEIKDTKIKIPLLEREGEASDPEARLRKAIMELEELSLRRSLN